MELRTEVRKSERGAAAEAVRRVPELHRLRRSSVDWVEPHRRHAPAVSAVLRIRAGYGDHICRDLMLSSHFVRRHSKRQSIARESIKTPHSASAVWSPTSPAAAFVVTMVTADSALLRIFHLIFDPFDKGDRIDDHLGGNRELEAAGQGVPEASESFQHCASASKRATA